MATDSTNGYGGFVKVKSHLSEVNGSIGNAFQDTNGLSDNNVVNEYTNAATVNGNTPSDNGSNSSFTAGESSNGFSTPENNGAEPIAIIGMGMRLPGAIHDSDSFWEMLVSKKNARCRVPSDRYNVDAFYNPSRKPQSVGTDSGYFLEDVNLNDFDAGFFNLGKKELDRLDPQQRLLMEVVWECLENAGETNWRGNNVGCYIGVFGEDWLETQLRDTLEMGPYRITGHGDYVLANRISYEFDFKGPSLVVKTGCSSALIGLHMACDALRNGDCTAAVVAGTNLILTPTMTIAMTEQGVVSPTGTCKSFDASADGYARGEAVNCVYIKKLSDAIADGDPIRGIIRATAINCDGKTPGISYPSSQAHETLIRRAYKVAGINDVSQTAMVECHGTGTPVGDPLETQAVARVFGENGVLIGSVKPNVGHSEGASGLTSMFKMLIAMEKKAIPPNMHFKIPNPKIPFQDAKLSVPVEVSPWPVNREERVSVNSFGIGGSNAHVVLDSAALWNVGNKSSSLEQGISSRPELLVFSANHPDSLKRLTRNYASYVQKKSPVLSDLAYTLALRRNHMQYRSICVGGFEELTFTPPVRIGSLPILVFVFTGQGAQWAGMGKELFIHYPSFRKDISALNETLTQCAHPPSWNLEDELLKPKETSLINRPELSQPLCVAIQIALVNLLKLWNIEPQGAVGHSSGEIAAAYTSGIITAHEAILIAYYRGYVMKSQKLNGGMAAIGLGHHEVSPYLVPGVLIACENSPDSVTISGDADKLEEVMAAVQLANPDKLVRRLRVDMAYHSHHMKAIGEEYQDLIQDKVSSKKSRIPFFSSVEGKPINDAGKLDAAYWRANLESPVLFSTAVKSILGPAVQKSIFLEIGPHSALAGPLRQIFKTKPGSHLYTSTLQRNENCTKSFLTAIGQLHCLGFDIDFSTTNQSKRVLTDLPQYPWHYERKFWNESRLSKEYRQLRFPHHDILGSRVAESNDFAPTWRNLLKLDNVPWIKDHKILTDIVFPAAGYIALVAEAIRQLTGNEDCTFRNVTLSSAMVLDDSKDTEIMTSLHPSRLTVSLDSDWYDFTISSYDGSSWTKNCVGQARKGFETDLADVAKLDALPRQVVSGSWYQAMRRVGLNYGPIFSTLTDITAGVKENTAVANVAFANQADESPYSLHPATLDPCFQLVSTALAKGQSRALTQLCLPTSIEYLSIRKCSSEVRMFAETIPARKGVVIGNAFGTADGQTVLRLKGLRLSPVEGDAIDPDPHAGIQLEWKSDIDFLETKNLIQNVKNVRVSHMLGEKLTALCILETSSRKNKVQAGQAHLGRFLMWIDQQKDRIETNQYPLVDGLESLVKLNDSERMQLIEQTSIDLQSTKSAAAGTALLRIIQNLEGIITGEVNALELLMKDDVLTQIYDFAGLWDYSKYFSALSHNKPHLRILEVGAGTGGTTEIVLNNLQSRFGERMYGNYTFTDISAGFFGPAKERFQNHPAIDYTVLDISKDPLSQGFEAHSYDLIIATNVIHATPVLGESLSNIHKLLHPDGSLFLQEICPNTKWVNFIMGLFEGWWLGAADNRPEQPFVSPARWDEELKKSGFSGAETVLYDDEVPYQVNANIFSKPVTAKKEHPGSKNVTILCGKSGVEVEQLEAHLKDRGYRTGIVQFPELPPANQDVISVLDLEEPFFPSIGGEKLADFLSYATHLQTENIGTLWVTKPSQILCEDPAYSQVIGLARTIRSEVGASFATLEVDSVTSAWDQVIDVFVKFQHRTKEEDVDSDMEFAISRNVIYTSRFHWISVSKELSQTSTTNLPKRLEVEKKGSLDTLHWLQFDQSLLGPNEVEVETRAIGMNFKDVLITMGIVDAQRSDSSGLGCECAGFIRRVGSNVRNLVAGDRVVVQATGTLETTVKANSKLCVKIPDSLSFEDAATMPVVYGTVVHSLLDLGRLEKGQTVLIHSAAGGVGIAAIQVCQWAGAEIFVTVGNEDKTKYLIETFGIPRSHIFHSRDASFLPDILKATNGKGVDLVLNSLSGDLLHASWQCVAQYGKMLEIGKRDFIGQGKLGMSLFEANRSFFGIDLAVMAEERPDVIHRLLKKVLQLYEQGAIKPIRPIKIFDATEIKAAFRYMQKGQHMGKIVLRMPLDHGDLMTNVSPSKLVLRSDASYLMIGGLGGLGKAISTWMAEHGARNLIFLSRSAGKTEDHKQFFRELEAYGCSVQAFAGSVSVLADVEKMIKNATLPIAGVMQMSMVLRDRSFAQFSIEDWNAVVAPKVEGTWCLHNALKNHALDFFILFSSFSGLVGQWGQANYAAANTFLDAFVQYRHGLGLPASVLDIGCVVDAGYVSENQAVMDTLLSTSLHGLHQQDVLDSLHLMMARSSPSSVALSDSFSNPSQVGIGLRSTMPITSPANRSIWKRDPRMSVYRNLESVDASAATSGNESLRLFLASVNEKPSLLVEHTSVEFLAREIGLRLFISLMKPEEDLDIKMSPTALGLDSLIAIDLRNWWRESFGSTVTVLEMMNAKSFEELGALAAKKLLEKLSPENGKLDEDVAREYLAMKAP